MRIRTLASTAALALGLALTSSLSAQTPGAGPGPGPGPRGPGRMQAMALQGITLTPAQQANVLGVQANMWTGYAAQRSEARVDQYAFPKLAALAEVAWSAPDRQDAGDSAAGHHPDSGPAGQGRLDHREDPGPDARHDPWHPAERR